METAVFSIASRNFKKKQPQLQAISVFSFVERLIMSWVHKDDFYFLYIVFVYILSFKIV